MIKCALHQVFTLTELGAVYMEAVLVGIARQPGIKAE
jgi:hypothetical protein